MVLFLCEELNSHFSLRVHVPAHGDPISFKIRQIKVVHPCVTKPRIEKQVGLPEEEFAMQNVLLKS